MNEVFYEIKKKFPNLTKFFKKILLKFNNNYLEKPENRQKRSLNPIKLKKIVVELDKTHKINLEKLQ